MTTITDAELAASRAEIQRIIDTQIRQLRVYPKRNRRVRAYYETWCYCSWCPHSTALTPHYHRSDCPHPGEYRAGG